MNVDTALSWLTWLLAGVGATAVVLLIMLRRWAARVVVIGVAALLLIVATTARQQISAMPTDNPEALCNAGINWFGIQLSDSPAFCAKYRTP